MAFKKGQEKMGGRVKGTPNKSTKEIRNAIQNVLANRIDTLEEDLARMTGFQRWMILDKVTKYVMPALAKNEDKVEHTGELQINITYSDPELKDSDPEQGNNYDEDVPF